MKKILFIILVLVLILCLPLAACGKGADGAESTDNAAGSSTGSDSGAATGAESDELLTIYPGYLILPMSQHVTLEATAKGNKALTWSSSDPSVATVDSNGRVTPLSEGDTFITVALADDANVTAVCSVRVSAEGNIFLWE